MLNTQIPLMCSTVLYASIRVGCTLVSISLPHSPPAPLAPPHFLLHQTTCPNFPPYLTIVWRWHYNVGISSPQRVIVVICVPYLVAQPFSSWACSLLRALACVQHPIFSLSTMWANSKQQTSQGAVRIGLGLYQPISFPAVSEDQH